MLSQEKLSSLARPIALLLVLFLAAGCGEDATSNNGQGTDAGQDAGQDVSADVDATGMDGGADADAEVPLVCDDFPAPVVAGTTQTDQLADNPEQCGQPAYQWLRDEALGEVVDFGLEKEFRAVLIEGLIRSQDVEPPEGIEYDVQIQQFMYKTQDRGDFINATGMIAYPQNYEATEPMDTVLLLHGTTGFMDDCAASADTASQGLAALFASMGYFVVAPDYIGLKGMGEPSEFLHPYLVGQATAIASLDSVRAAGKMSQDERGGFCLSNDVMVFGGSQGGHAALWVDRLAPYYAREFDLLGTIATVPPADLVGQMERALVSFENSTGNTIAFLGTVADWYGYGDRYDEIFVDPLDTEIPAALGEECRPGSGIEEPTIEDVFQPGLYEPARNDQLTGVEPWGCITAENGLTTTSIERIEPTSEAYGILSVYAENDELVNTPIERDAFSEMCNQGLDMQYLECAGAGHVEGSLYAVPEILDFMAARMAGETFDPANLCQVEAPTTCRGTP
ncbi:MAG: lipase family protein [Myxococcota bacterium]